MHKAVIIKYVRCVRHFVALSLRILKSTLLLNKDFLCSSNQKMSFLNVVQNGLKSLHTSIVQVLFVNGDVPSTLPKGVRFDTAENVRNAPIRIHTVSIHRSLEIGKELERLFGW